MKIDTEGTYTLTYTATDSCGNSTSEERTVVVASPRTVLYTDGTFIINEQPEDRAANVAAHGEATNTYAPFDSNGATSDERYEFASYASRPWESQRANISSVIIGSNISPTSTKFWFGRFSTCVDMDLINLDTSMVTNMYAMFENCSMIETLDLSTFDTTNVSDMGNMFYGCSMLKTLNLSNFNTTSVTIMSNMFYLCEALETLDISGFNTGSVTTMRDMFTGCKALTTLDVSSFDTSSATDIGNMFRACKAIVTIYVSTLFVTSQVQNSSDMFYAMSTNLVGGAGTTWRTSNPTDKTYARIDNPPDAPGYFTLKE